MAPLAGEDAAAVSARAQIEALVLRRTDYGEADRILTLLTREDGLIRAIAKNARASRRRFGGAIELFSHVRCDLGRKRRGGEGLEYLNSAEQIDAHLGLRGSLAALRSASVMCEATSHLIHEHEAVPLLFDQLRDALSGLGGETPAERMVLTELWYVLRLLDTAGHAPHLDRCVRCGRDFDGFSRAQLSRDEGGIVCEHCLPAAMASALPRAGVRVFDAIARCRTLADLGEVRITAQGGAHLLGLVRDFAVSRIGKPLNSLEGFGNPV